MYICLMSFEKTELLTLGDYMSTHIVTKDKEVCLPIRHKTYIHKTPTMLLIWSPRVRSYSGCLMYICLMYYEKTELLTLGDYMSNIAGV
jgi:hypothetical protein